MTENGDEVKKVGPEFPYKAEYRADFYFKILKYTYQLSKIIKTITNNPADVMKINSVE